MTIAGAAAREMLIAAGAAKFGVQRVRMPGAEIARRPCGVGPLGDVRRTRGGCGEAVGARPSRP